METLKNDAQVLEPQNLEVIETANGIENAENENLAAAENDSELTAENELGFCFDVEALIQQEEKEAAKNSNEPEVQNVENVATESQSNDEPEISLLAKSDITQFSLLESKTKIRYALLNNSVVICADDLFGLVFGIGKYHQRNEIVKLGIDAQSDKGELFFSLDKIASRLYDYDLPKATYEKQPEKYAAYINFMKQGGVSQICTILGIDTEYEVKDISYLLPEEEQTPAIVETAAAETAKDNEAFKAIEIEAIKTRMDLDAELNKVFQDKVIEAVESLKTANNSNVEAIANELKNLQQANNQLAIGIDTVRKEAADYKADFEAKIETAKTEAANAALEQRGIDPLRARLTSSKIWFRIAIFVTMIFMPFTVLGLHKYIAIETPNMIAEIGVFMLCIAIAAVWDGAILLFAVNGKHDLVKFGSIVQFVFFSAKFDFIAMVVNDFGYDGYYWQKMAVVLCAVTYSPVLLNQIADLATRSNEDKN